VIFFECLQSLVIANKRQAPISENESLEPFDLAAA